VSTFDSLEERSEKASTQSKANEEIIAFNVNRVRKSLLGVTLDESLLDEDYDQFPIEDLGVQDLSSPPVSPSAR